MRKIATKIVRVNGPYRFLTAYAAYYFLIHIATVEALVSDHPRELKKVVATRTGRLREFDREIAQCRKNYLYVYTVFKLIFF